MNLIDLDDVNLAVNRYTYQADATRYGRPEFWTALEGSGDCEDFAIAKLRRLVAKGWPINRLRLACCFDETGAYHAVLIVATDEVGDMMLDNRQPYPVSVGDFQRLGYKPDRIQAEGGSQRWVEWKGAA
jgi:predicted transglutaminase-like cysteine proteinase